MIHETITVLKETVIVIHVFCDVIIATDNKVYPEYYEIDPKHYDQIILEAQTDPNLVVYHHACWKF